MTIDYTNTHDADRLLAAITDAGATPPQELTDIIAGIKTLSAPAAASDPTADLISQVIAGDLSGKQLEEAIAAASAAQHANEFRQSLRQRVVRPGLQKFMAALKDGAADQIIDSLREPFDAAAAALLKITERVEPGVSAEAFLASADADGLAAWGQIDKHLAVLDKIAAVVGEFGPHGSFELVSPPQGPVAAWSHEIDRRALLFTGPDTNLAAVSQAFRECQGGATAQAAGSSWRVCYSSAASTRLAKKSAHGLKPRTMRSCPPTAGVVAWTPMRASSIRRLRTRTSSLMRRAVRYRALQMFLWQGDWTDGRQVRSAAAL